MFIEGSEQILLNKKQTKTRNDRKFTVFLQWIITTDKNKIAEGGMAYFIELRDT